MVDSKVPKARAADTAHAVLKAVVSGVPVVGGSAAELFGVIVPTSLEQRRQRFFESLDERLRRVEDERGIRIEDLAEDEGFITIVVEATKAALGTHLEEKVELLTACIESAALHEDRDDFLAMRLLQYVGELSPEHFIVLKYCADPSAWYEANDLRKPRFHQAGSQQRVLDGAQLPLPKDVLEIALGDLDDRGLATTSGLGVTMSADGAWQPLATDRGRHLLDFVRIMDA